MGVGKTFADRPISEWAIVFHDIRRVIIMASACNSNPSRTTMHHVVVTINESEISV